MNRKLNQLVNSTVSASLAVAFFFTLTDLVKAQTDSTSSSASSAPATPSSSTTTPAKKADTTAQTADTKKSDSSSTQTLDTITVQDQEIAPHDNILPTRPISSVYGTATSIQDTPRSVTEINAQQLEHFRSTADFANYTPGVIRNGGQNRQVVPTIRGQEGELYQNGMLLGNAPHPADFNAYENADVVAGPAPAVFGPTINTSGYINLVTKQAYLDQFQGSFDTDFGKWTSGGKEGYADFKQTLDFGGPIIKDQLGYRVSYTKKEADSYYGAYGSVPAQPNNLDSFYGTLTWLPNKDVTIDGNFSYGNYEFSEYKNINRITQDLISNGNYITGNAVPVMQAGTVNGSGLFSASAGKYYVPVYTNGALSGLQAVTVANGKITAYGATQAVGGTTLAAQQAALAALYPGTVAGKAYGWVLPANSISTKIPGYDAEVGPSDVSRTQNFISQSKQSVQVDDDFKIVNNDTAQYYHHTKDVMDSFYAYINHLQFEDRVEFQLQEEYKLADIDIKHNSNSGLSGFFIDSLYGQTTTTQSVGFNSPAYDITQGPSDLYNLYGANVFPSVPGLASGGVFASGVGPLSLTSNLQPVNSGDGDTIYMASGNSNTHSIGESFAPYTQHAFIFDDTWTWNIGGRATVDHATATNPFPSAGVAYDSVLGTEYGDYRDETTQVIPSFNTSLQYKPVPWTTLYATYNYSQAIAGNADKGYIVNAARTLDPSYFHQPSILYEGGAKFEFIPNQFYGTASGYWQQRELTPVTSALPAGGYLTEVPQIQVRGADFTLQYQPNKNFSTGSTFNFIEANYVNYKLTTDPTAPVADGQTIFLTGTANPTPPANWRVSGIPKLNFNYHAQYKWDNGFGVRSDWWATSSWQVMAGSPIKVPSQYNIDLAFFYEQPKWFVELDLSNITNERNWMEQMASESNYFIQPLEPFGVAAKAGIKF